MVQKGRGQNLCELSSKSLANNTFCGPTNTYMKMTNDISPVTASTLYKFEIPFLNF